VPPSPARGFYAVHRGPLMSPRSNEVQDALAAFGQIKQYKEDQLGIDDLKDKIYFNDCRDILERVPDGAIDLVITDPPWGIDLTTFRKKFADVKIANDEYRDYCNLMMDLPSLLYRALKPEGCAYVFCGGTTVRIYPTGLHWVPWDILKRFYKAGFKPGRILIWDKVSPGRMYKYRTRVEFVFYFVKQKTPTWTGKGEFKEDYINLEEIPIEIIELEEEVVKYQKIAGANKVHMAEKPHRLYESFIEDSSKKGEIIFDPFCGSAPIIEACKNTGRYYLAVEKEVKYKKIIKSRANQITIFEKRDDLFEPEQENLFEQQQEEEEEDEDKLDEILGLD